jgi:hypothetical protein
VGGCPSWREPLTPGKRFRHACGAAYPDSAAGAAPPAAAETGLGLEPVAERRVCSVLFCDMAGFTPLLESRDPEDIRELRSEHFAAARGDVWWHRGLARAKGWLGADCREQAYMSQPFSLPAPDVHRPPPLLPQQQHQFLI